MATNLHALDWALVQTFIAVAEEGSLSAAARRLSITQPSVGRQVKNIEESLNVTLFRRIHRGLELTETGTELLGPAREMQAAAAKFHLTAEGHSETLSGTVRITASTVVSHYTLPPILAKIRRKEPEIQLELVPSDTSENLLFREADIAIRMYRPTQLDVITRHVCDLQTALYASKDYINRHGKPQTMEEIMTHDFIGFDRSELIIEVMGNMGFAVDREFFPLRTDSQVLYWELVRAGCGIGAAQRVIGDNDPKVERLFDSVELPSLPVWLTAPEILRGNPRIRRVFDLLAVGLARLGPNGPER